MLLLHVVCLYLFYSVLTTKSDVTLKCSFYGNVPLGQYLPCYPCSESQTVSSQNYRYLKLRPNETGLDLLLRIQKMQQVDKSGHVLGFIIGSTLASSKLPKVVFQDLVQLSRGKRKLPPLIFLNAEDYELQFQRYSMSHNSSVKEMKCLSNIGSKFMKVSCTNLMASAWLCLLCCLDSA